MFLYGSIDLTKAQELGQIKRVQTQDGDSRLYLNIQIADLKEPREVEFADGRKIVQTHYVKCEPAKDKRQEGVKYFIGNLQSYESKEIDPQQIEQAEVADKLPF